MNSVLANCCLVLVLPILSGCFLIDSVGGAWSYEPEALSTELDLEATALVEAAYLGIDAKQLTDFHTHIIGTNTNGSGTFVNPKMFSWKDPVQGLKGRVYMSGADVTDIDQSDQQYLDRLVRLIRAQPQPSRYRILAFDQHYNADGTVNEEETEFYTPNAYVFKLAADYPDLFIPTISVHPYRLDALEEVEKWAKQGARYIKWLPNAMGIDASAERLEPYYQLMREYNMVLLTHVGEEQAVEAEGAQNLGNPLLFRRPLNMGVKVIMAHCGSLGMNDDLDNPGGVKVPSYELFLRLMDEPRYRGKLFGELSAITQANRLPEPLTAILQRIDLHDRIVNGSDYPLPGVNVVIQTRALVKYGFISADERMSLNEIYNYNPLLFDFVLKRTLRLPDTDVRFPASIFMQHPDLPLGQIDG